MYLPSSVNPACGDLAAQEQGQVRLIKFAVKGKWAHTSRVSERTGLISVTSNMMNLRAITSIAVML